MTRLSISALLCLWLGACASSAISPQVQELTLPEQWTQVAADENTLTQSDAGGWLLTLKSPELVSLVSEAQVGNHELARQFARVQELAYTITSEGADRWPGFDLDLGGNRSGTYPDQGADVYTESWQASLNLSWELDIWGKLSDRQRQAELNYQAELATLRDQQIQLATDVATGWFETIANTHLEALLSQRLHNVSDDLESLEQGFRRGLSPALDVYLSRNTVADSRVNLARQQQTLQVSLSELQLLLGRYPDGSQIPLDNGLPDLDPVTALGAPANLLQRRADIQQAWLSLLAADAELAVAHKDRFPGFSLTGSVGTASDALHGLVDAGLSSWTIGASLSQPLFQAGRLKALEEQARTRVKQAEQSYLYTVYNALAEVEQSLAAEGALKEQLTAQRESRSNADLAYELSLQQYSRGLVDYTTVLESQRRAFDAETATIELQNEAIANRIKLYRALGGDFSEANR
ncbi:MAG: efflux transporter outer membrane subunit [Parahaliea sp.]